MLNASLKGKNAFVKLKDKIIAFWLPEDDTFEQTYSSISASLERCLRPGSVWVYEKHRTLVNIMVTILRITHCLYCFSSKSTLFQKIYCTMPWENKCLIQYYFQVTLYIVTIRTSSYVSHIVARWAGFYMISIISYRPLLRRQSLPRPQQSGAIK